MHYFLLCYDPSSSPLWHHYDTTSSPLWHHQQSTMTPLWHHQQSTMTPPWRHRHYAHDRSASPDVTVVLAYDNRPRNISIFTHVSKRIWRWFCLPRPDQLSEIPVKWNAYNSDMKWSIIHESLVHNSYGVADQ